MEVNLTPSDMATSMIQSNIENYSLTEQVVGKWIDGKTIYRKCKVYTWAGSINYDSDFFSGIAVDQIINQRIQIMSASSYAQTSYYWSASDYARCWITLTNTPPVVSYNLGGASNGAQVMIVVDYTKA